ncbi:MAG TPA: hypothetical protein VKB65_01370 [Myxococcota bacterium]|nr:hypothetical protein [Myxococcota bacterium]
MPSKPVRALALALGLLLGACSTTRIVDSWTAPDLTPSDLQFHHVVAIAALADPTSQRVAEDAVAQAATRTRVTPAYEILTPADRGDPELLRAALAKAGVDGAVTVRLLGVDERTTYVPGTTRLVGGGYYGYYGSVIYEPGYYRTDRVVRVETTLHDVASGKLLWSGVSESINPANVRQVVAEIVAAARADLKKQGLLP